MLHYARERRRRGLPLRQQGEYLLCTLLQAAFEGPQPPLEPVRNPISREQSTSFSSKKVGIVVGRLRRRQVQAVAVEQQQEEQRA